jgi:DNA repair exonuclease SbcCD nuclease subunit
MSEIEARGFLFVGDPHLATRTPGFRKDDYPRTILKKLRWCLDHASSEHLVPVLLGDVFHFPRDNANWLLVELFELCRSSRFPVLAVVGNHDCYENSLGSNDTLAVIHSAGALHLLDAQNPWHAQINQTLVVLGGSPWNERLPEALPADLDTRFTPDVSAPRLVFWVTHHDIAFAGYEQNARVRPREIPGLDVVINGHIHRPLPDIRTGRTTWLNPGNIARVSRSAASRERVPAALRLDVDHGTWSTQAVPVPCEPFDAVFFEMPSAQADMAPGQSVFVSGLAQLEAFKSATGAGLRHFLDTHLDAFEEPIQAEIRKLADEVLDNDGLPNEQH